MRAFTVHFVTRSYARVLHKKEHVKDQNMPLAYQDRRTDTQIYINNKDDVARK